MIVPEVHFDCPNCGARLGVVYVPEEYGVPVGRIERTGICSQCGKGVGIDLEISVRPVKEDDLHPEVRDIIAAVARKRFDGTDIPSRDRGSNYFRCFNCHFSWHADCMNGDVLACPKCHTEECKLQQIDLYSEMDGAAHKKGCPYDRKGRLEAPQAGEEPK